MKSVLLVLSAMAVALGLAAGLGTRSLDPGQGPLTIQAAEAPQAPAAKGGKLMVPHYEWDPYWPKRPLPNKWAVGNMVGVYVDSKDHVWVVHRPRTLLAGHEDDAAYEHPESECCVPAPAVIEFDQAGAVVQAWGGPPAEAFKKSGVGGGGVIQERFLMWKRPQGYQWAESEHTIFVDHKDNVWVGNNGGSHILKFTRDGKYLLTVGVPGKKADSNDTTAMKSPAGVTVDPKTNELYVADGYGNRRVIVWDADTGAYKRHWGAYGKKPDDSVPFKYDPKGPPSQQMNTVHCVWIDNKDEVYVCDRANSRIQVFKKDGTFIKEASVAPATMRGSVLDLAFSKDKDQTWMFVADGRNEKVWILRKSDMKVIGSFGHASHWGGGFTIAHNIAIDSRNNIYVTESLTGQRVQRFLYKGLRPATVD
jgi:sugar lactone lactonase YvrE